MSLDDLTRAVNEHKTGLDRLIGLEITEASPQRVSAQLAVADCHKQIHGIVHGGVYSTIVETLGSIGAALSAREFGRTIVGLDNHTSFLRAVNQGTLTAIAEPVTAGRRTQIWSTRISDASGKLVALGQLRLLCIEKETLPNARADQSGSPFST